MLQWRYSRHGLYYTGCHNERLADHEYGSIPYGNGGLWFWECWYRNRGSGARRNRDGKWKAKGGSQWTNLVRNPSKLALVKALTWYRRCLDKQGLLLKSYGDDLTLGQLSFAREDSGWEGKEKDLLSVIKEVKPHVLVGTSTRPGSFTEEIIKEMAKHVDRPIVLPLSNPTRLHEAVPQDIFTWTEGKALIATGSPFSPVKYNGQEYEVGRRSRYE